MAERLTPFEAGLRDGRGLPLDDDSTIDRAATLLRPAVATAAPAPSPSERDAALGAAEPESRAVVPPSANAAGAPAGNTGRPRARRSNPATKNAPDHAGKRAVGGVS